ncbi:hypothetical protein FRB95_006922 [Tulasnella sp. JGI-2019a]|nr:hypothetical protein FRB95_006922 [Tulasnella sp. JGI-2019a]
MEDALARKDLNKLSSIGDSLKCSSAPPGVTKVQASCERIQHNGALKVDDGLGDLDRDEAVKRIGLFVGRLGVEIKEAKKWFDKFHGRDVSEDDRGREVLFGGDFGSV